MKKLRFISILAVLTGLAAVVTFTNCGYRLSGLGKQIPDHIRTIVIPDFENKTTRIEAEQFVTYAVKEEFIRRSQLELVPNRSNADAILEGEILTFTVSPESITEEASANLYRLTIVLAVRLIDLTNNEIIFEDENINFSDSYDIDDEDFFSQETEKLLEISDRFAESVVTTILENF
jgi:outer membrane lipopolysaccharide assembly protein LptE/RlpB